MAVSQQVAVAPLERIGSRLAWLPLLLTVLFGVTALWLLARIPAGAGPSTIGVTEAIGYLVAWVCFSAVGSIIVSRAPRQLVGWLCCAVGTGIAAVAAAGSLAAYGLSLDSPASWALTVAWLAHCLAGPMGVGILTLLLLVLPDGRLPSQHWWPVPVVAILSMFGLVIGLALAPMRLIDFPAYQNPYGLSGAGGTIATGLVVISAVAFAGTALLGIAAVILRFRRSSGDERRQLQWIAFGGAALLVTFVVGGLLSPNSSLGQLSRVGHIISSVGIAAVAVGIGIAVTRYRLYDIDVVIDRSLVYGGLTAILAGVYTASIRLFNALFVGATGEGSEEALVITTLILATTFTPIKRRLEGIVERRYKTADEAGDPAVSPAADASAERASPEALDERIRLIVRDELASQTPMATTGDAHGPVPRAPA